MMSRLHRLSPERLKTATLVVLLAIGATACKGSDDAPAGEAARNVVAEPTSTPPIEASAHDPSRGVSATSTIEVRAPATPPPTATEKTEQATAEHETQADTASVLNSEMYRALTPEQQKTIKRLHDMSEEEYRQVGLNQEFVYAEFGYDTYKKAALDIMRKKIPVEDLKFFSAPSTLSENSTGQQIENAANMRRVVANYVANNENGPHDLRLAHSMLRTMYADGNNSSFLNDLEELEKNESGEFGVPGYRPGTVLRENHAYQSVAGTTKDYQAVGQYDKVTQHTSVYTQVPDIAGEQVGLWLEMRTAEEGDPDYIPEDDPQLR
jgi:hypothetical protein